MSFAHSFARTGLLIGAVAALGLMGCKPSHPASGGAAPAEAAGPHGINPGDIDPSIKPGDDFYGFANGHWLASTEIPADQSSWSSFSIVRNRASKQTADLIQDTARASNPEGSDARKVADYYLSFMDDVGIEKKGLAPIQPLLTRIDAITDLPGLSRELGLELRTDVDALNLTNFHTDHLFGLWVSPDWNQPDRYTAYFMQGGLGLPDRDYYTAGDPKMAATRAAYLAHIAKILKLAGVPDADAKAAAIMALETKIARAHWTAVQSRDVLKANNPWTRQDFDAKAPGIDWNNYFGAAGLSGQANFIAWQPSAISGLSALVKKEPIETWKAYLTFHALDDASPYLSSAFAGEQFAFYGNTLSGTPQIAARWKRAVDATNGALGWAVGKLYVDRYFPPEAKAKADALVQNIIAVYRTRIQNLAWMSPETKAKALEKLKTLWVGVGYPDRWPRDYSALQIVRGDAYGNWERAQLFEYRRNVSQLSQPVDHTEWHMTPQTVNAVNFPIQNGLNIPAAIMQPPFFDAAADPVYNYGAVGVVIGHEISHAFDNQGAQFDAQGRLSNWWTKADFAHFDAASRRLVAQYNAYKAFPDLHLNGQLTIGENIADVAGLTASHDAYLMSLQGRQTPAVGGYTGEQQFFLAFAQMYRAKFRDAALRRQVLTNEHSPGPWRAATVRNNDAWYAAFGVKPGDKAYLAPAQRVQVF